MAGRKLVLGLFGCLSCSVGIADSDWRGMTLQLGDTTPFSTSIHAPHTADSQTSALDLSLTVDRRGAQLDWHPLGSDWRLSGGLLLSQASTPVGILPAMSWEGRPYLGLGWGERSAHRSGLALDVGLTFSGADWAGSSRPYRHQSWESNPHLWQQPWRSDFEQAPLLQLGLDYSF